MERIDPSVLALYRLNAEERKPFVQTPVAAGHVLKLLEVYEAACEWADSDEVVDRDLPLRAEGRLLEAVGR